MTKEEAKRIMEIERTCVLRQDTPECGRDEYGCGACDLVQSSDDVIEAYGVAIKALEQEPCEDEYIKVPKKALKYRTAGMVAYNAEWLKNNFDIERAVICGTQEPCEDAISRQAAIRVCCGMSRFTGIDEAPYEYVEDVLRKLPSVTPQPKTGNWIAVENEEMETVGYYCSECDFPMETEKRTDYCPNCGVRMIEEG